MTLLFDYSTVEQCTASSEPAIKKSSNANRIPLQLIEKKSQKIMVTAGVVSHPSFLDKGQQEMISIIPTLQQLTGNVIRKYVEEERKDIIRNHSGIYENKRIELEIQRKELQRQLDEVDQQMKFVEIDCHKDMLTELDHFDNEKQPQLLSALTDVGQPDRICPLCEKYFSSTTELPHCSLGKDKCYLHTIQRCCFSCLRPGFYDVFQCLAVADNNDMNSNHNNDDGEIGIGIGIDGKIVDDLATIETASTKSTSSSWMLDQLFFGRGGGGQHMDDDNDYNDVNNVDVDDNEYNDNDDEAEAEAVAEATQLVPSTSGSVNCPCCKRIYCDHDFLYHFRSCHRRTTRMMHNINKNGEILDVPHTSS
ncbi:MAG: hypothetical protein ACI90V_012766 [Bacillariaceae sp.]|jgi:hypothetical protein